MNTEHHEMHLEKEHPSGFEEWVCPVCGRKLLMRWPPDYTKVVVEPGNEMATHSAVKGGLELQNAQVKMNEQAASPVEEDERLAPWIEALKNIDF